MEENEELRRENRMFKEDLRRVNSGVEFLDRKSKRNNVIVAGLDVDSGKIEMLRKEMVNFFKESVDIDMQIRTGTDWDQKRVHTRSQSVLF